MYIFIIIIVHAILNSNLKSELHLLPNSQSLSLGNFLEKHKSL